MIDRTVLITGATDGIGLELAKLFQTNGARLIVVGRRSFDELTQPPFERESYCVANLAEPDSADSVLRYLDQRGIRRLDLLIHNAATGYYGAIENQPGSSIEAVMAVNLLAPVRLTRALLPMVRSERGKIVFISSVVTLLACPDFAVYAATKSALEGLARNLATELEPSVSIQVIRPGATRTGLHAKCGIPREVADWQQFPPAGRVARHIFHAINSSKRIATIGTGNLLMSKFAGWLPGLVDRLIGWRRCTS